MLPIVQLDNKGLFTYANLLSQVPPGSMTIASNVIIDRPGIVETRRGFNFYGTTLSNYAVQGFIYDTRLIWYQHNGTLTYDSDGAGTWVNYAGSYFPPTNAFIESTQSSGNFYFTTNNGIYKLSTLTGTPQQAGVAAGLDITAAIAGTGSAVLNNSAVAYQVVFGYIDANNNLILGAPSEYFVLINTSGTTQNVNITASIPSTLTTADFIQVYRTPNTMSATVLPGNNYQLVVEQQLTSGDIAAHSVTVLDQVPDALLGADLYTDDGQPTNLPNTVPPLALDICTYQGMTFYFNFSTPQSADITLDSVGAPNGIQVGDTISITDNTGHTTLTYTAAVANNFPAEEFAVVTTGSIGEQIDGTARNLVAAINQDPANTLFYAYYVSTATSLPGQITLQARNLQQITFYVNSSRATPWTPQIPPTGMSYISSNNNLPGSFVVSKVNQPEAVPLAYTIPIQTGNINIIIYRGLALQDAVYVFTNGGVFRITGTDPTTLQVLLFDSSAILVGLQTPQILNNSIYYFSSQATCNVSSGGNQIVSRPVERDELQLSVLPNFGSLAYGVSYESDRKYFLFSPTESTDTLATECYVYNWITQAFTTWDRPCTAAIVNPSVQLLYVTDQFGNVFQERKSFTNADYADQQYNVTITSTNPTLNTITLSSAAEVLIGDVIQQTVSLTPYSTQVTNITGNVLTVLDATGFAAGAAIDYRSIVQQIEYCPITCGFAEYMKKILSWQFMFENPNFTEIPVTFTSDLYTSGETVNLVPIVSNEWGEFGWGEVAWGVTTPLEQLIPTWPTKNTVIAHWFIIEMTLTQAFTSLSLNGLSATFDIVSTRGH
jgi:hypothetical protein